MKDNLNDIRNMLLEVVARVRHLSGEIDDLKQQVADLQKGNKEEKAKEKTSSPTPLSLEKKEKEEKGSSSSSSGAYMYARPRDIAEVEEYIDAYCKGNRKAFPDVLDGEEFFDIMEANNWTDENGQPVAHWKRLVRTIIRFRSDLKNKRRENLNNKARLENLRHHNIMLERGRKEPSRASPPPRDEPPRPLPEARIGNGFELYQQMVREGKVKGSRFVALSPAMRGGIAD